MSGENRRLGAPQGPPWSLELLADFHAGALDQQVADEIREQLHDDQGAHEVLTSLDTMTTSLRDLPPLTMPEDISDRIDAALRTEAQSWHGVSPAAWSSDNQVGQGNAPETVAPVGPAAIPAQPGVFSAGPGGYAPGQHEAGSQGAQIIDFEQARRRRNRKIGGWIGGLAATAAAALGAVFFAQFTPTTPSSVPQALPSPQGGPTPALTAQAGEISLSQGQFSDAMSSDDYSALADQARVQDCLHANGAAGQSPMGARPVTVDGKPAQLFILSTGQIGQFRVLVVDPACSAASPGKISEGTYP